MQRNAALISLKENRMYLFEKEILINHPSKPGTMIGYLREAVNTELACGESPIRFVITNNQTDTFQCEVEGECAGERGHVSIMGKGKGFLFRCSEFPPHPLSSATLT